MCAENAENCHSRLVKIQQRIHKEIRCFIIVQGETELSFRLIPSLTQSHTKPRTKTVREEVILAKEGISLKDNSVSQQIKTIMKLR